MGKSRAQFGIRALLGATALAAIAVFLTLWARDPGTYMAGAGDWELSFLAKIFTLPIICGVAGAAIGLLTSRPWTGLLAGLAVAGVLGPFLFVGWFQL